MPCLFLRGLEGCRLWPGITDGSSGLRAALGVKVAFSHSIEMSLKVLSHGRPPLPPPPDSWPPQLFLAWQGGKKKGEVLLRVS